MKVLELFCGTKSFSKEAEALGHDTFTVDFDPRFNPDMCINILDLKAEDILNKFGKPDVIWASPPCTCFSVASIWRYWDKGQPKNQKTFHAIEIVKKTLKLIEELEPTYFIIENPRGMLRKQEFMLNLHRDTVTYCQYGLPFQKATDLWNNLNFKFKPMCSPKSPCHVRAPRGSSFGIQGIKPERKGQHPDSRYTMSRSSIIRSIVPSELCKDILIHINNVKGGK